MDYYINSNTLAIIPFSTNMCKIIEADNNLVVNIKTTKVINNSCRYYFSSLLGRLSASEFILNSNRRLPVIISETDDIIFFPTNSIRENECCWINFNNIKNVSTIDKKNSLVEFKNNYKLVVGISLYSLNRQINFCTKLKLYLLEKKMNYFTQKV